MNAQTRLPSLSFTLQEEPNDNTNESEEKTEKDKDEEAERPENPEKIQLLLADAIRYHAPLKDIGIVLKYGADVNGAVRKGLRPLHYAAYHEYIECVYLLLHCGAEVNVTDDIGYTPLHLCARRGNFETMKLLVDNGAKINFFDDEDAPHDEKTIEYLTMEPLNLSIQNNNVDCVRLLLDNGARPNNRYFMGHEINLVPLENTGCLLLLLQYGANPNVFNRGGLCPLMKACKEHQIDSARVLINYGADINAQCPPLFEQKSVLQFAIQSGNIVIINLLLQKKARLSRNENYKYSALHSAILKGRADIVELLLKHKAEVDERTEDGGTALMLACATTELKERQEIVDLLIKYGADINARAPSYKFSEPCLSPLTEYLQNIGSTEGFSLLWTLVRNGARIHFCRQPFGAYRKPDPFCVLHFVHCMKNFPELFEFLVAAGRRFDVLAIHANDSLPDDFKEFLVGIARSPLELKHQCRVLVNDMLLPHIPEKVPLLTLPKLLKSYLLYKL